MKRSQALMKDLAVFSSPTLVGPAVLWCEQTSACILVAEAPNEKTTNHDAAKRNHPLCDLHPQIVRGGARAGIQFAAGAARSLRGLHQQPASRRLGVPLRGL